MTDVQINNENAIIEVIRVATGLARQSVFPHKNFNQLRPPVTPFVTVEIVSDEQLGEDGVDTYLTDASTMTTRITQFRTVVFSVRYYGPNAHQLGTAVSMMLKSYKVRAVTKKFHLGSLRPLGSLANLSGRVTTEIEQMFRQDFTAQYGLELETGDEVPVMDSFEASVTLQKYPGDPEARTITIESED